MNKVITSSPILALPRLSQPFIVECDAFGAGLGVVLMQNQWPIDFEKRNLNDK